MRRAAREELGAELTAVTPALPFRYRAAVGNGLVEHEYDHVFTAHLAGPLAPVAEEVAEVAWQPREALEHAVATAPATFTPWFRMLFPLVAAHRAAATVPSAT